MQNLPAHLSNRAALIQRIGRVLFRRTYQPEITQPSMAWFDGPRTQPRDGRGRFLSKAWLADAELFLPADVAWFRHPVTSEER